jgi:hypothetical protein
MNKIDYVVISSDDNPLYKDFYPIVANQWKRFGFRTYYINITDKNEVSEDEYGIVHKIKALDFVSTGFQSQVVRLFACNLISGNLLMSDVDMLPLNEEYFNQYLEELQEKKIIVYSGQPYNDTPYYPMCYVLGHSSAFVEILNLKKVTFHNYCTNLLEKYGENWNTDEHFMYEKFQAQIKLINVKKRDYLSRIDRSNWKFKPKKITKGYYVDSHMLRPYLKYKKEIDLLINFSNNKIEINQLKMVYLSVMFFRLRIINYINIIHNNTFFYILYLFKTKLIKMIYNKS